MNLRVPLFLALTLLATACSTRSESDASGPAAAASAMSRSPGGTSTAMPQPALAQRFAALPDRGALVRYPVQPVVRHDGAYTWHRADLSEAHARAAVGGILSLTSPSGEPLRFRYSRHVEHPNGDWTWVGESAEDPSREAIITFGDKAAFGSIGQPGKEPLRLTIANGTSWIVETDPRQIAGIVNAATRPTKPDFFVAPEVADAVARRKAASGASTEAANVSTAAATAASGTTVDVVIGYTNGFVSGLGGESQAQTRLNFLVDVTNEAYVNSQVNANVRLVKTVLVNYPDATSNSTALEELTGFKAPSTRTTPNAAFSALRAARDQYGADLVSLVRKFNDPENDGCGIAWLIGGGRRAITQGDESFGYSVVSDGRDTGTDGKTYFCRDETFAHELGHNMGSAHDRDTADGDDNVLQNNEYGAFDYSFGYKTTAAAGNFYTVMAYGDTGQTRYRVFSNPRSSFCGGKLCGSSQADNALTLSQTIPLVAGFRATVVPLPTASSRPARDVNGDLTEDLVWYNPVTRELYAWFMSSWMPSTGASGGLALVGTSPRGVADFGGDGRSDVLLSDSTNVYMLTGNGGGGYAAAYVGAHPAGYSVLSVQDTDADGKADVIWYNASTGALQLWKMNGAVLAQSIAAGNVIGGTIPIAVGDSNGDRRADVVLASPQHLYMLMGTGSAFTAVYVAARPVEWTLLASRDVDGDEKADFVWYNSQTSEIYYWLMNGSVPVSGRGGSYAIGGTTPITVGDYNGDGRADVLLSSGSNVYVLRGSAEGKFNASYVAAYPTGWAMLQ